MMADDSNSCGKCTDLEFILHEKNCEIQRLEVQIKNLKTVLRDYETQANLCQLCSVIDTLKSDTFEELGASICSAKINKREETNTESIHYSQSSRESFTKIDVNKENLHEKVSDVEASKDAGYQNKTSENENSLGYIYDENIKMYFYPSSGYYYDPKSTFYYHPQTHAYYKYNSKGELCEITASNKLLKEDCDSVLEKVNSLNITDDDFISKDDKKVEGSLEDEEILDDGGFTKDWKPTKGSKTTVTDLVRDVAEQVSGLTDYIYDEKSAMYYNQSTGHFYDPVKKLLYDPQTKVYYLFKEETGSYEVYCKADDTESMSLLPKNGPLKRYNKKKSKKGQRKKKTKEDKIPKRYQDDSPESYEDDRDTVWDSPEEGEIVSTSDSDSGSELSTESNPSLGPPCIRAIVKRSAKLKVGSLILITCTGAIIGREKFNTVCLPEIGVSKTHAEIIFNRGSWKYEIEDFGSQNGTFVNDIRLSEPKQKSKPLVLKHGDHLVMGNCELLLHIHTGYITCDECEPGQVMAEIAAQEVKPVTLFKTKKEKEKERRKEKNRLKKKYGLQGIDYVSGKKPNASGSKYKDKAEIRRKTVGSQNPYEKTEAASMQEGIAKSNIGFQMLQKLGWKEGDSLGLNGTGISEPITVQPWFSRAGLGSSVSKVSSQTIPDDKRKQKWVKAQERYSQLT